MRLIFPAVLSVLGAGCAVKMVPHKIDLGIEKSVVKQDERPGGVRMSSASVADLSLSLEAEQAFECRSLTVGTRATRTSLAPAPGRMGPLLAGSIGLTALTTSILIFGVDDPGDPGLPKFTAAVFAMPTLIVDATLIRTLARMGPSSVSRSEEISPGPWSQCGWRPYHGAGAALVRGAGTSAALDGLYFERDRRATVPATKLPKSIWAAPEWNVELSNASTTTARDGSSAGGVTLAVQGDRQPVMDAFAAEEARREEARRVAEIARREAAEAAQAARAEAAAGAERERTERDARAEAVRRKLAGSLRTLRRAQHVEVYTEDGIGYEGTVASVDHGDDVVRIQISAVKAPSPGLVSFALGHRGFRGGPCTGELVVEESSRTRGTKDALTIGDTTPWIPFACVSAVGH